MFEDSLKILPCPSCESQNIEYELGNFSQMIRCSNCGRGISSISSEDTKKSMIEQWNKSVTEENTLKGYTGFNDKNGKGIYNNDIIKISLTNIIGKILYKDNTYQVVTYTFGKECCIEVAKLLDSKYAEVEVIGNIFDNPELFAIQELEKQVNDVTRKYNDLKAMLKLVYTDIEEMSRKCGGYCEQCMLYNNGEKCKYKHIDEIKKLISDNKE